ncbi:MAG: hypothetical protein ACE5FA_09135 [Dehalococcoidia bacterium]
MIQFEQAYSLDEEQLTWLEQDLYDRWVDQYEYEISGREMLDALSKASEATDPGDGSETPESRLLLKTFLEFHKAGPLSRENTLIAVEAMLPPGDYTLQRRRFEELEWYPQQRDYIDEVDAVRRKQFRRYVMAAAARTAPLSDTGRPMPRWWHAQQVQARNKADEEARRQEAENRHTTHLRSRRHPDAGAIHRFPSSPGNDPVPAPLRNSPPAPNEVSTLNRLVEQIRAHWMEQLPQAMPQHRFDELWPEFAPRVEAALAGREPEFAAIDELTSHKAYDEAFANLLAPLGGLHEELRLRISSTP